MASYLANLTLSIFNILLSHKYYGCQIKNNINYLTVRSSLSFCCILEFDLDYIQTLTSTVPRNNVTVVWHWFPRETLCSLLAREQL